MSCSCDYIYTPLGGWWCDKCGKRPPPSWYEANRRRAEQAEKDKITTLWAAAFPSKDL